MGGSSSCLNREDPKTEDAGAPTKLASSALDGAKYYTFPKAPNPQLTDIFMREKGLDVSRYEVVLDIPSGQNRTEEMYKKNPTGSLPFLELSDGSVIAETMAICEYLEELVPEPALIGATTLERGQVRAWQRRMEEHYVYPTFNEYRFWTASVDANGTAAKDKFKDRCCFETGAALIPHAWKDLREWAKNRIYWLERVKAVENTRFFCGDRFTVVDIQVYTTMKCFSSRDPVQQVLESAEGKLPWVQAWYDRVKSRPSVGA